MSRKNRIIVSGLALAVLGTTALVTPALAHGPFGFGGTERGERLAEALGIPVDELRSAQDQAFENGLAEAVESGRITAEQADLMRAQYALKRSIDHTAVMAEALGVDSAELEAAREDGTLPELYESLDIDRASLRERMQAAHEAAVQAAVESGVITAEQAEALENGGAMKGHGLGHGLGRGRMGRLGGCQGGSMDGSGVRFLSPGDSLELGRGFDAAPRFFRAAPVESTNL